MLHESVLSFCILCFSVRATGPSAGKCSKHPTEIAREEGARETRENLPEAARETAENLREQFDEVPSW